MTEEIRPGRWKAGARLRTGTWAELAGSSQIGPRRRGWEIYSQGSCWLWASGQSHYLGHSQRRTHRVQTLHCKPQTALLYKLHWYWSPFQPKQLLVLPHVAPGIQTPAHLPHKLCCSVTCSLLTATVLMPARQVFCFGGRLSYFHIQLIKGSAMNDKMLHSIIEANLWTVFSSSIAAYFHKGLEKLNQVNN